MEVQAKKTGIDFARYKIEPAVEKFKKKANN